ncbi:dystrobrevin binding protein dysbindin [Brevipalpus obovatus]|uniref:dystrobrevin binding protein dysbindin n=1 Tax=Brevipalpus obovatus TaxID=246614 RepID=UPI003D9FB095
MLESFRDKIQNVQSLSTSLLDLSTKSKEKPSPKKVVDGINFEAGFSLLSCNQKKWEKLHSQTEANAKLADDVAQNLAAFEARSLRHNHAINNFLDQCSKMSLVEDEIQALVDDFESLKKSISQVESILDKLHSRDELNNFVQFQAEENYKFSKYKERKNIELDALRNRLAAEHAKKIQEFEKAEAIRLKEKHKLYHDAFEEQLQLYKTYGKVVKVGINGKSVDDSDDEDPQCIHLLKPLEEIDVEPDEADKKAYNSFLESVENG